MEEDLDNLRVQTAQDAATIHELRTCLEQEREGKQEPELQNEDSNWIRVEMFLFCQISFVNMQQTRRQTFFCRAACCPFLLSLSCWWQCLPRDLPSCWTVWLHGTKRDHVMSHVTRGSWRIFHWPSVLICKTCFILQKKKKKKKIFEFLLMSLCDYHWFIFFLRRRVTVFSRPAGRKKQTSAQRCYIHSETGE